MNLLLVGCTPSNASRGSRKTWGQAGAKKKRKKVKSILSGRNHERIFLHPGRLMLLVSSYLIVLPLLLEWEKMGVNTYTIMLHQASSLVSTLSQSFMFPCRMLHWSRCNNATWTAVWIIPCPKITKKYHLAFIAIWATLSPPWENGVCLDLILLKSSSAVLWTGWSLVISCVARWTLLYTCFPILF